MGLVCVLTVTTVVLIVALAGRDRHATARSEPTARSSATSSIAAPAGRAPVPVAALLDLLPDRAVVSSAVEDPDIDLVTHGEYIDAEDLVDADCQGIPSVASRVYAGSGWTAIRWQRWNSPAGPDSPNLVNHVSLSVATYPQADAARVFYTNQSTAWRKCNIRIINSRLASAKASADQRWFIDNVTDSNGVLAAIMMDDANPDWFCQTRLTARNNVVVRVGVCAHTTSATPAETLLASITRKIDAIG
ncbi:sensor domain-containing protein [Mycolicibacter sinensis]|uniref:sensor domain-containing protein n=1 Tax=Mycolicibacter sinensis (strain JDM601) TaxID=875328 RepID=UPI00227726C1|nr:sensor domain-containing protein [Mycolicibacter sinensis]